MQTNLERLADWINTHDGGTPQPRAVILGGVVMIRSTEILPDRTTRFADDTVSTYAQARAVLGY